MLPVSPHQSGSASIPVRVPSGGGGGAGSQPVAEGDRQSEVTMQNGSAGLKVTDRPARVAVGHSYNLEMVAAKGYLASEEYTVSSTTVYAVTAWDFPCNVSELAEFVRSVTGAYPVYVHLMKEGAMEGAFRIKLYASSEADLLLQSDKLFRHSYPLIFERWSADRCLDRDQLRKQFVWVTMPGLPLQLVNMVNDMIALIGKVVTVPRPSEFLYAGRTPKWGVQVAAGTQLPRGIRVQDPDNQSKVVRQKFCYPVLEGLCKSCSSEKHRGSGCPNAANTTISYNRPEKLTWEEDEVWNLGNSKPALYGFRNLR